MTMEGHGASVDQRLAKLSPSQRALLERRLMERRMEVARSRTISPREDDGPAPLSHAQELLWLLSQVFDDGIAYNAPGTFQVKGPLDAELLSRALAGLVERHSVLRTTYHVIDGTPMQVIGPPAAVELNEIDLRHLGPDEQRAESQRILKTESRYRFDLVEGPVIRPTLVRLAADEHIFMLNMHHVATDGYSRSALYRDLTALYEAFANGLPSPLVPLQIQYADYAAWHRKWLDAGVADGQLEYWKRKLAGAPSRLDLPTDFPRPPVRSWVGDHMSMMVDLATREALRTTARNSDATLFVALLAIFGLLLSRYSGQEDIVLGTPFASRNRTELESMVGYFINPLALRLDLSGDPTFEELLARARETTLEAFANADVPYESVVRATNPERDLSQTPVFQAMVVFHNPAWQTERPKFEPEGLRSVEISHEKGWAKFDLLLGMSERTTGLNTTWEYSTELFKPASIARMMEHFRTLAESAGASPGRRLSKLSMLSEAERAKVVHAWNSHPEPLPERESIKELFEEQVARTPDAQAIVFEGDRMTFAQLNEQANRIAWLLRDRGVGHGKLVGILMEKSLQLLPAVLGVVKAGGAYIPLDPLYPPDRIDFMVSDSKPELLLTLQGNLQVPLTSEVPRVPVDAPGALEPYDTCNPPALAGGRDLAYVIYTSGSTGEPKGAMIQNRSLVSAYFAYERAYRLRELRAHAQMASFSFDVFTGDVIRSLLAGAKLVLCPIETVVDPGALYELMLAEGIDAAEFVPATASLLFEHLKREGRTLEHMRLVIVSSEAWRNDRYVFFKSLCGPRTRLINAYGLTEATIDSTWFEPNSEEELLAGRFVPIGRPLDNTRAYILDGALAPQPIGIPGELCIGGVAVARGYLNRPELSVEKFVPDPFGGEEPDDPGAGQSSEAGRRARGKPEGLLYRTGDLARWLPDGTIDFLGRTDRQIKIRGFRIEPGEIEAVLERHPRVRAAAVVDRTDPRGEPRLVAYIDADGAAPSDEELRAFVSEHVPGYMVPSANVLLDELPYTPNGKVDRDALPDPEWDQAPAAEGFVAPRTETERAVAGIWAVVLGTQEISIRDNFFALGGHSLIAMQVMSRVRDELGVALSLRSIFDSPTVMELAAAVDLARESEGSAPAAPALVRMSRPASGASS
jgi:amino acid adenylation domain-containing protein